MLSAHRGKSQGRPRTTSSSQLIGYIGLPVRVSHQRPVSRKHECSRRGRTGSSCPDNGSCYVAHAYRAALHELGLRQLRIKPGRPRTIGKAERFIQTLLNEWAYPRIYGSSAERTAALPLFLNRYNYRRPHGSLGKRAPATRLNNLVRNYI